MLSIHLELLDKERRKVFENLRVFSEMAVLGGGTALALQILLGDFIRKVGNIPGGHILPTPEKEIWAGE